MKKGKGVLQDKVRYLFYFLIFNFLLLLLMMFTSLVRNIFVGSELFLLPFTTFCVGGFLLVYWVKKDELTGEFKKYLNIVGYSAGLVFASVFFHNIFSAIGIYLTGNKSFEEPVFFLLAIIILPILFVYGVIKLLLLYRKK